MLANQSHTVPSSLRPCKLWRTACKAIDTDQSYHSIEINSSQKTLKLWDMQEQRWTMRNTSSGLSHTSRHRRRIWSSSCRTSVRSARIFPANTTRMNRLFGCENTSRSWRRTKRSRTVSSTWRCPPASSQPSPSI